MHFSMSSIQKQLCEFGQISPNVPQAESQLGKLQDLNAAGSVIC